MGKNRNKHRNLVPNIYRLRIEEVMYIVDDKHIRMGDTVTSLSGAAKRILGKKALQGPLYWTYNGKVLNDIRIEVESKECEREEKN